MEKQGLYLTSFQRKLLEKSLQNELRPEYRRRIEIMLLADAGQSQTQICKALGCSVAMTRHWSAMAQAGQAHNWNNRPMGRPKAVNEQYIARLKELVSHSPRDNGYSFQRWTAQWLGKHLEKELDIKISPQHINRLLKQIGLSTRYRDDDTVDLYRSEHSITIGDLQSNLSTDSCWNFNIIQKS